MFYMQLYLKLWFPYTPHSLTAVPYVRESVVPAKEYSSRPTHEEVFELRVSSRERMLERMHVKGA